MRKKNKGVSSVQHRLIWMSCRYAIGRSSIASQSLPNEIIQEYYHELTPNQRKSLADDVFREIELRNALYDKGVKPIFDVYEVWHKFALALDSTKHITAHIPKDNSDHVCFVYENEYYPLDRYIRNPYVKCTIPVELIEF